MQVKHSSPVPHTVWLILSEQTVYICNLLPLELSESMRVSTRIRKLTNCKGNRDSLMKSGGWIKGPLEARFHKDIILNDHSNSNNHFRMRGTKPRSLDPQRCRGHFTTFPVDGVRFNCTEVPCRQFCSPVQHGMCYV
jgi:hypothetical protein